MTMLDLPAGLHPDISEAAYHARIRGIFSKSIGDLLNRAPALYLHWLSGAVEEDKDAFRFGKAFHCMTLEPDVFGGSYAVEPEWGDLRTKHWKDKREQWRGDNAGKQWVPNEDAVRMLGMIEALRAHPLAGRVLSAKGRAELTMRWQDPATGVQCKGRADWYVPEFASCFDLKSCENASRSAFRRDAGNYGYHRQDALYRDAFAILGAPVEHFVFICVEKAPPHLIALYELDAEAVEAGQRQNERLLRLFAECLSANRWDGYDDSIVAVDLPPWVKE